jgi:hypothetical protein
MLLSHSGHDYENAPDVMQQSGQDWSLCANGTIHQGSVQAAVNEFFASQGSQVVITYREAAWNSWMVRKPYICPMTAATTTAATATEATGGTAADALTAATVRGNRTFISASPEYNSSFSTSKHQPLPVDAVVEFGTAKQETNDISSVLAVQPHSHHDDFRQGHQVSASHPTKIVAVT